MTYKRGHVGISVDQLDRFGKNPSLRICTDESNQMVKVASFGSFDKAFAFCKCLEYLLGFSNDEQAVKCE